MRPRGTGAHARRAACFAAVLMSVAAADGAARACQHVSARAGADPAAPAGTPPRCCRLLELGEPGLHPLFVKQVVTVAMDRRDRDREMASGLLSQLHPQVISADQVRTGWAAGGAPLCMHQRMRVHRPSTPCLLDAPCHRLAAVP